MVEIEENGGLAAGIVAEAVFDTVEVEMPRRRA